ncbi:MAG TPA: hypothetical protein VJ785_00535 [Anaerolineales bacterium]|nr:hypothetical protein [Anaerolineales bacterium]
MLEIGPKHTMEYRHEILSRFFQNIQSADSFCVIGAASMGKTRLLDHLMKTEVQRHYLGDKADKHWLIRVDLNRMPVNDPTWAFYELLISSILLDLNNHEKIDDLETEFTRIDSDIIQKQEPLLALRLFELVINKLCQMYQLKLCFLLDEFDEAYQTLPREIFLQLRAVRDANKNRVSFSLFLRNLPERLRPNMDNESFYELLSRESVGIGPYRKNDAIQMMQQLEARKQHTITPEQRDKIFQASGGHPGLILSLFGVLTEKPQFFQKFDTPDWPKSLIQESAINEECRKLWEGLSDEEQQGLLAFREGEYKKISLPVEKLLFLKGLLRTNGEGVQYFSELFEQFVEGR